MYVFGRLKPDQTMEQAAAGLNAIYRPILHDVEAPLQTGMSDVTMERFKAKQVVLAPGRRGQSGIHEEASAPLYMLFSITGVVLLIACANIANLLLARGAGRATEMGVRLALGARAFDVVRQVVSQGVALAAVGVALGLVGGLGLAFAISSLLFGVEPSDPATYATVAVTLISVATIASYIPARRALRQDPIQALRQ